MACVQRSISTELHRRHCCCCCWCCCILVMGKSTGIDSRHRIKVIIFDSAQSAVTYRPAANIDSELSLRAISNLETPNNKSNITARYKSIANHKIRPAKCDNIAPLQPPGVQSPLFSWLLQIESFNHIRWLVHLYCGPIGRGAARFIFAS